MKIKLRKSRKRRKGENENEEQEGKVTRKMVPIKGRASASFSSMLKL